MEDIHIMGMFKPPICPNCNIPLTEVWEVICEIYSFNPETGFYDHNPWDESDMKCPCCGKTSGLVDIFPDGVCNYQAKDGRE